MAASHLPDSNTAAQLEESERRFRQLADVSAAGIIVLDRRGDVIDANDALLRMTGYTREDLQAGRMDWRAMTPPEWMAASRACAEELRRSGVCEPYEKEYIRKDGMRVPVIVSPTRSLDGEGITVAYVLDISARRSAEDALRRSEERYRTLFETLAQGVIYQDAEGRITSANAAALTILGLTLDQLQGRTSFDPRWRAIRSDGSLFPGKEHPAMVALSTGQPVLNVLMGVHHPADNRPRWLIVNATPQFTPGKARPIGVFSTFEDVTERRQAEEERDRLLAESQTARAMAESALSDREDLVSVITHDLRNPLALIKVAAQLARRQLARPDGLDPERLRGQLDGIEAAAGKMAAMLGEMLDVARLNRGGALDLSRAPANLGTLAAAVVAEHDKAAPGHTLTVEDHDSALMGEWDAARIERVIANLVSNAIKYSPAGGPVTLTLDREHDGAGDHARLVVRDHGLGIPEKDVEHIFERFYRATNVAGRIRGTGLGLAGARDIVEQHGGTLTIASEEGAGTSVTVRLPLS